MRSPSAPIPLSAPRLAGHEARYVLECVRSGWISSAGPFVERFERDVAERVGVPCAVATASGTAALHVALRVAGIGPGDAVLVPTLSFIAPANAVRYVGALPLFVDVEARYWQMDPERLAGFLRQRCRVRQGVLQERETGARIRAVVAVHLLGHPVDMDAIRAVAAGYELLVVEDAAEALGARHRDVPVGRLADLACLSFNGNKTVTAGGGGMLLTTRRAWAERARYLTTQAKDDPVEAIHGEVGFNYRLSGLQAALGCAQLEQLDELLAAKRAIAASYAGRLADVPGISLQAEAPWAWSSRWLATVRVEPGRFGADRGALFAALAAHGIESRPLWQPLHRSPAHAGAPHGGCPVAETLQREALSLPSSVDLDPEQIERVVGVIRSLARRAA